MPESSFIYLTCQRGAEKVLKAEIAKKRPNCRFSYSQPGFLTYKVPDSDLEQLDTAALRSVFARTCTRAIGKISGEPEDLFSETIRLFDEFLQAPRGNKEPDQKIRLHVWAPDRAEPRTFDFEPGLVPEDRQTHQELLKRFPDRMRNRLAVRADQIDFPAAAGELALDVVRVSGGQWWLGYHPVKDWHSRYSGGLIPLISASDAASRAWLKFEEGLRWADFPIEVDSRCVDIGAAPGGGSQALLSRGAEVLGVDPAEMDQRVLAHPNFTHLRGKINQLKRALFRKSRWFIADMNVAPRYTLDAFEEIVMRPDINARGLLFTLKFFDWKFAGNITEYIYRIKSWGFNKVKARQLCFNRQEIMIAALKKPFHH